MIFSVRINQVSDLQILMSISYSQLYITFMHRLIVVHLQMLEVYFMIYLKLLIG